MLFSILFKLKIKQFRCVSYSHLPAGRRIPLSSGCRLPQGYKDTKLRRKLQPTPANFPAAVSPKPEKNSYFCVGAGKRAGR
jgi:hypothetical protein